MALECVDGELNEKGEGECPGGMLTATGVNLNDHFTSKESKWSSSNFNAETLAWRHFSATNDTNYIIGLFNMQANIRFNNATFTHFRAGPPLFFIVAGNLFFTNVDFEKIATLNVVPKDPYVSDFNAIAMSVFVSRPE